ncbi:metal-dependent phosphohydrolase [Solidesulfovibrio carbinolicus]|nr:metal-dependent phosphohydrolase [Solidesulfovibrio carbinolicus]
MDLSFDRRAFLRLGLAVGGVAVARAAFPTLARAAASGPAALAAVAAMTPLEMADASPLVGASWQYLRDVAATIANPELRAKVEAVLDNPAPTLAARLADPKHRAAVAEELAAKGWLKGQTADTLLPPVADPAASPQPFRSAPGSGYQSHHAYPGGLPVHVAVNMRITLAIFDAYKDVYGFALDRDTVVVSQMLHDLHKPWVFAWSEAGASRPEQSLAGTGEHHVLSVAESIVRGIPAEVVVAQACAHNHPGSEKDEAEPVAWLKAAAVLAGVDAAKAGLIAPSGDTLPLPRRMEGFVCHLGDHDWVLSVPAGKWSIAALAELARDRYGIADDKSSRFNAFRNYVFSQATMMELYQTLAVSGKDGLAKAVAGIVAPA